MPSGKYLVLALHCGKLKRDKLVSKAEKVEPFASDWRQTTSKLWKLPKAATFVTEKKLLRAASTQAHAHISIQSFFCEWWRRCQKVSRFSVSKWIHLPKVCHLGVSFFILVYYYYWNGFETCWNYFKLLSTTLSFCHFASHSNFKLRHLMQFSNNAWGRRTKNCVIASQIGNPISSKKQIEL